MYKILLTALIFVSVLNAQIRIVNSDGLNFKCLTASPTPSAKKKLSSELPIKLVD